MTDTRMSGGKIQPKANFFDLPREVRDLIYAYFPYLAAVHINQDPSKVLQPNISKICRQMRKEALEVFYSRNNFFLDLRGWKAASYPRLWTPRKIFEEWVTAIGDENAAHLRNISFFSHTFRINVKISPEKPHSLALKFRTPETKADVAEGAPRSYTFSIAAKHAENGLRRVLDNIEVNACDREISAKDIQSICDAVDTIQPFLCKRMTLGYQGAYLHYDQPIEEWPSTEMHRQKCDDCGYHRYERDLNI